MGAGSGTRMFPLTHFINKHLLHLGGKPVIRIIAEKIATVLEQQDITIVCNQKDLQDYQWEFRDMPLLHFCPFEGKLEGIGTARQFSIAILQQRMQDDTVLLHYGDTITDLDYGHFIDYYNNRDEMDAMIAITQNIKHDYSQVLFDVSNNMITNIEEKPNLAYPSWTGIGIFVADKIKNEVLAVTQTRNGEVDIAKHILPRLVKRHELHGYLYDGRWFDVGNLRSYKLLVQEFQNKPLNL